MSKVLRKRDENRYTKEGQFKGVISNTSVLSQTLNVKNLALINIYTNIEYKTLLNINLII